MNFTPALIEPMSARADRLPLRDFGALQNLPDPIVAQEAQHPKPANWNPHSHDRAQLIHVVAAPADVDIGSRRWTLRPGQAIWLPGGIEHSVRAVQAPHFRSLYFRPDVATGLRRGPEQLSLSPFLIELMRRLTALFQGEGDPATYPHLVGLILSEFGGAGPPTPDLPMPADRRLDRICRALCDHPGNRRTLAEWATLVGASPRTLERQFRAETGMGFGEWRQRARILAALPMLQDRVPVQVVSWQVGYDSPSAFTAAFRKIIGVTPTGFLADP